MENRVLIAVAVSIFILVIYQEVVLRYIYPPPPPEEQSELLPTAEMPTPAGEQPPAPEVRTAPAAPAAEARRITIDTPLYRAVFTSAGARLASFQLKHYRTTVDPDSPYQELVVPTRDGELPFGVELRGPQSLTDGAALYTTTDHDASLESGDSATITFIWDSGAGTIHKQFVFNGDRYEFATTLEATNVATGYTEVGLRWPKAAEAPPQPGSELLFDRAVYLLGRKLSEEQFDKLTAGKVIDQVLGWAGYAGRHFLAVAIPAEDSARRLWLKERDHTVDEELLFPVADHAVHQQLEMYLGPKDFDALARVGHHLSDAVNLGWFWFIAVPMLHLLKWSHQFTRNYGVDIIILTLVIKILFIPLTQRSFRSMREMQKLQPQMAKIREKFKDAPEQMNKEIMELYRRHKVNPLGGCLPMVLQIPVFIGLYQSLLNAVELRHAPFGLWINDLSAPDRLGGMQLPFVQHPGIPVLTLLMGVSMFVQQWMSPSAGDPTQQRVMLIMPLMFTFMFVNFPAGLALYWLVNNLLTIAQQYYMNRTAA